MPRQSYLPTILNRRPLPIVPTGSVNDDKGRDPDAGKTVTETRLSTRCSHHFRKVLTLLHRPNSIYDR